MMTMVREDGVTLPSASKSIPPFVIIGSPTDRRVALFQAALAALELPAAHFVSYIDLIAGKIDLATSVPADAIVRIESPGKHDETAQALLSLGADVADPEGEMYERVCTHSLSELFAEKGRLLPTRQWYLGYCLLLDSIARQLPTQQYMNSPDAIRLMFDKRACHALLSQHGIAVPPALQPVHSYDELLMQMHQQRWSRVFLKPAHGSSASGVIAYRFMGTRNQVVTTIELVRDSHQIRLYNTRQIRVYEDLQDIRALIDALCRQRVHVEQWIPKAGYAGRILDLRMVVIAGQVQHTVLRLSRSPMTNLHLLNQRGDVAALRVKVGAERWQQALQSCERAADLFDALYTGIDVLFTPDFTSHAILEMNAFGDLLPGVLHNGYDTYAAEILAALQRRNLCLTHANSLVHMI